MGPSLKTYLIIIVLLIASISISCKKILKSNPDDQMTLEESLKTKDGFIHILSGIYAEMGSAHLYGRDLKFGMLDVMAGYWDIKEKHEYIHFYNFDYAHPNSQAKIYKIWFSFYKLIRQCNQLLSYIDNIKYDTDYRIIKGEIIGLRGFFHFELFKLFGPVIDATDKNTKTIPYYIDTEILKGENKTVQEFLNLIESDLNTAKSLLIDDPIKKNGRLTIGLNLDDNLNFMHRNRGWHLNYYAVSTLLARKLNWERKISTAAIEAEKLINEILNDKSFNLITQEQLFPKNETINLRFTVENIFGLYINKTNELINSYFQANTTIDKFLTPAYYPLLYNLYGPYVSQDLRHRMWLSPNQFQKFIDRSVILPEEDIKDSIFYKETQIINLSELYFIASEGYIDNDISKSIHYLNIIRDNRGLASIELNITKENFKNYLLDEIRREYIGEGMLFYYYKNFNHEIYHQKRIIPPNSKIFILPIPSQELIL